MTRDQLTATGGRDVHTVRFPVGTPPAEVDVLVVGAGPVGLSSAIELSGRGTGVAVVDRARTATLIRAGAMGHSARTVEQPGLEARGRPRRVRAGHPARHLRRRAPAAQLAGGRLRAGTRPPGHRAQRQGPQGRHSRRRRSQPRAEIGALIGSGRFESAGVEFDERYDASPAIWDEPGQLDTEKPWQPDLYQDDPRPGHRAPDGYVDPWGDTLYDRIGNDFALLVLTANGTTGEAFAAEAAARSLPFTVIHLPDPAVRELYGADNVLIRPDQHVAWRGARIPDGGAAAVLDRVLGAAADSPRQ